MSIFRFKRFLICDDNASMKVGTDAVLLGAWSDVSAAQTVLDIGTGCGVIAIMLAQRTANNTVIDAVELLEPDSVQAQQNVSQSPWPGKVHVFQTDIGDFHPGKKYDLIVSNPPYFVNSLLPPTQGRTAARHSTMLTSDKLINAVVSLLSDAGKFNVILPASEAASFIAKAKDHGLFVSRYTKFFSRASKPAERSLMEFSFEDVFCKEDTLILYESGQLETEGYRTLTGGFYLDKPL
jgi:tRNA1Val (adenine37-N6)-methyltransferase